MKKQPNRIFRRICMLIGACLLVAAVLLPIAWQWGMHVSAQKMASYVQTIRMQIPEPQSAAAEVRGDNTMPPHPLPSAQTGQERSKKVSFSSHSLAFLFIHSYSKS